MGLFGCDGHSAPTSAAGCAYQDDAGCMMQPLSQSKLLAIILLEGFVTISVEILAIRQLMPFVGNSVVVTSLIIGVFLLFLAYGYRRGGEYTFGYREKLKSNFTIVAILTGIGLSYVFISLFFSTVPQILKSHTLMILMGYLLLIVAPIVYLLGQTVPITVNLFKHEHKDSIGAISGRVLHLSTIGSFLGAVLTTLLLMNYLGVAWTVVINVAILILLVFFLIDNLKYDGIRLFILTVSMIVIGYINIYAEKIEFLTTTPYGNYQITKGLQGDLLMINGSSSSFINDKKQGFEYIEAIKKILFDDLRLHNKKILVLGAGGFTLSAERDNGNEFTYVDIDPEIAPLTRQYFLEHIRGKFYAEDARIYIKNTKQHYDAIVSDVYSNKMTIPAHLLTQEHFLGIKSRLTSNGIAIFNIIAGPTLDDPYSKRVDNTIRSVFRSCMAMSLSYKLGITNIIYICSNAIREADKQVYTDNKNSSTMDFFGLK
jgi:spermidine synthase